MYTDDLIYSVVIKYKQNRCKCGIMYNNITMAEVLLTY